MATGTDVTNKQKAASFFLVGIFGGGVSLGIGYGIRYGISSAAQL